MDKKEILNTVKSVREHSPKRNFTQNFDVVANLNIDFKKEPFEAYTQLPIKRNKKAKICALIDKDIATQAKEVFDTIILKDDFDKLSKDKKQLKKLAKEHAFFIAQANIMPQIATAFGKVLGPKGKMPNPKAGCVIPPKIPSLKPIYDKLQNTVKLIAKVESIVKCPVGQEDMKDEDIVENVFAVYNHLVHSLPKEAENIVDVYLKLTMGPSIKIGSTKEEIEAKFKEIPKKEVKKDAIKKE